MGGNGSKAKGLLESENSREYKTLLKVADNIVVVEAKKKNARVKLPEESHTPNRIYVAINRPPLNNRSTTDPYAGKLKSIAVYGSDCKKLYEIHVDHTHNGLPIHYHPWCDGQPIKAGAGKHSPSVAYELTLEMKELLNQIYNKVPHV